MATISEEAIRDRAYKIWEREGRPHGCDFEHWVRAQVELLAELSGGNGRSAAAQRARGAAAKSAPPATNGKSAAGAGAKAVAAKPAAAKPSRGPAARGRSGKKPA